MLTYEQLEEYRTDLIISCIAKILKEDVEKIMSLENIIKSIMEGAINVI